eukprot:scaffold6786_cov384-Prasinococcus_capsulatus_cf.AAC.11
MPAACSGPLPTAWLGVLACARMGAQTHSPPSLARPPMGHPHVGAGRRFRTAARSGRAARPQLRARSERERQREHQREHQRERSPCNAGAVSHAVLGAKAKGARPRFRLGRGSLDTGICLVRAGAARAGSSPDDDGRSLSVWEGRGGHLALARRVQLGAHPHRRWAGRACAAAGPVAAVAAVATVRPPGEQRWSGAP